MNIVNAHNYFIHLQINANSERRYRTREFALDPCNYNSSATYLMGKSPFPELDKFIESVASTGSVPGNNSFFNDVVLYPSITSSVL